VYSYHVQGVSQEEIDTDAVAQTRDTIPAKDALNGHDKVFAVWLKHIFKSLCRGRNVSVCKYCFFIIDDADVHCSCS
jgi:hypothetical protein